LRRSRALFPCFPIEKVIMPNFLLRLRQASVLLSALACTAVHAAPFAYVPNEKSGTVSVIDTATDQVVRQIAAGKRPRGIAADPGGRQLFVTDAASSVLLLIDNEAGGPVRAVALGKSPEGVSASRDGAYVAVAVEENNSVALLDGHTGALLADIKV
jgi:YVTN family beta-propeller protein